MLHFNELRLTPDSKHLIIDVEVNSDPYYNNVVVDSIVIDYQDTFIINGPSSHPIYTYKVNAEDSGGKRIKLYLSSADLGVDLSNTMLFIYAMAGGAPAPETPCGLDKDRIMGTVIDLKRFFEKFMLYLQELNKCCVVPKGFIDMYLQWKAIEVSVKTGNYLLAIKYWKKFLSIIPYNKPTNNCQCYG